MDATPDTAPAAEAPELEAEAEDQSELTELADELAAIAEEHGADSATLTLNFPEEHTMYGWDVTVTVKAQYEECDEEEEEDEEEAPEAAAK